MSKRFKKNLISILGSVSWFIIIMIIDSVFYSSWGKSNISSHILVWFDSIRLVLLFWTFIVFIFIRTFFSSVIKCDKVSTKKVS